MSYEPAEHYDRVTAAWVLLLGEDLHYGVFNGYSEDLASATSRLTQAMIAAGEIQSGNDVLDVGCGTGAPACQLARALGARVTGITTSTAGVQAARRRAAAGGFEGMVSFERRDGVDNGFPNESFDRVWVLESSHLMRERERLVAECARVLRPGGRLVLCDIVLRQPMKFAEVRRLRKPLALLREVFGDARMETLAEYRRLAQANRLLVDQELDLTAATAPTFARWRENAERHREQVVALTGEEYWRRFHASCGVLEAFWADGTLGYALISAAKP